MSVKAIGITVNVLMSLFLLVLIFFALYQQYALNDCLTNQSTFCYSIQCPCDLNLQGDQALAPCFGYAQREIGNGQYVCSLAPRTIVDSAGSIISSI